ncbi:MAG: 6-bladed beta-propeller [Planctomycetota bacterium]|nr:6-bladed beta-propeller [Planctomycetota bacterium]
MRSRIWLLALLLINCCVSSSVDTKPLKNVELIGGPGRGVGRFFQPRAIEALPQQQCIVIDRSGRAQRFDVAGELKDVWMLPEWSAGHPIDLCSTSEGTLLVADTHYMRIIEFDIDGNEVRRFGEDVGLELVRGIDVAADGSILVASYGELDRIFRFDRHGQLMKVWGERGDGPGQFLRPEGLAIDVDGTVLVVDCGHHRVLRFTLDGEHLQTIGAPGRAAGQFDTPFDIDTVGDGSFVVVDKAGCRVQRFRADGSLVAVVGGTGRRTGQLSEPRGVAVSRTGPVPRLLIADTGNHRVVTSAIPGESR